MKYKNSGTMIKSLSDIQIGDPVVHIEHGVGRYEGLKNLDINGQKIEFLMLKYQNNAKLYIPILSLNLISRFIGASPNTAPLHTLGSNQWEKTKKKARKKAYDAAAELLEIEAIRKSRDGFSFDLLSKQDYDKFVKKFQFKETPDQKQVIEEVIADMRTDKPMDRLICGDVGFGKTEVVLRASFIAVMNKKQVVILVPTTLLAQQHYQTFLARFADFSIKLALISRFNKKKESSQLLEDIKKGAIDIVIGTHRLLQKDVYFNNLGLLIIDEEHQFGVRQKDKIKRFRNQVDILSLTATPIPRTLSLAMSKLRDMSIISTPPNERLSIKTFIRNHNSTLIREACLKEIRRGGKVYFVHNNIQTIEATVRYLIQLIPEAKINFGHGQMGEVQLKQVMKEFYCHTFNILVCTTIIESGIDIPSANTIIIDRADRFGLAQLHQIRGRVGRSSLQAYAYLLIPDNTSIKKNAIKRLDAINSMENLGSGFALASHDLEIRGAGELLGETQSGLIDNVGYSLYSEYLSMSVQAIKEKKLPIIDKLISDYPYTTIDLNLPAFFQEDYLSNTHERLVLYSRISSAKSDQVLKELQIEIINLFGLLPQAAKNLFKLTSIRLHAEKCDIQKIEFSHDGGIIKFHDNPSVNFSKILQLIKKYPERYYLSDSSTVKIKADLSCSETRISEIESVLNYITL